MINDDNKITTNVTIFLHVIITVLFFLSFSKLSAEINHAKKFTDGSVVFAYLGTFVLSRHG